jgi:hypothetical protein
MDKPTTVSGQLSSGPLVAVNWLEFAVPDFRLLNMPSGEEQLVRPAVPGWLFCVVLGGSGGTKVNWKFAAHVRSVATAWAAAGVRRTTPSEMPQPAASRAISLRVGILPDSSSGLCTAARHFVPNRTGSSA